MSCGRAADCPASSIAMLVDQMPLPPSANTATVLRVKMRLRMICRSFAFQYGARMFHACVFSVDYLDRVATISFAGVMGSDSPASLGWPWPLQRLCPRPHCVDGSPRSVRRSSSGALGYTQQPPCTGRFVLGFGAFSTATMQDHADTVAEAVQWRIEFQSAAGVV
jgi:hypothetical protein